MQNRVQSMLEAWANVAIGYVVALLSQLAIFPLFGIHVPLSDNLLIGGYFTMNFDQIPQFVEIAAEVEM